MRWRQRGRGGEAPEGAAQGHRARERAAARTCSWFTAARTASGMDAAEEGLDMALWGDRCARQDACVAPRHGPPKCETLNFIPMGWFLPSPLMNFTFSILASAAIRSGARSAPRRTWYPIGRWAVKERGRGGARGGQQARKGQKGDRKSQRRTGLTNCKRASSFFSASAPRLRRERRSRTPSRIRGLLIALLAVYAAIFGPAARAWDAQRARALGATSAPGPHILVRTATLLRPQVFVANS